MHFYEDTMAVAYILSKKQQQKTKQKQKITNKK